MLTSSPSEIAGQIGEQGMNERVTSLDTITIYCLMNFLYSSYENRDGNGAYQTGFMIPQGTLRRGSRCSAAKAFLRPIRHRKNLHIAMEAMVTKVMIDQATKTAYGVKFKRNGKIWVVHARKEVILSAGALNSPHLLMLSGIGPSVRLHKVFDYYNEYIGAIEIWKLLETFFLCNQS